MLRRHDYLLLTAVFFLLSSLPVVFPRGMNIHHTVHCQNAREMLADGDLIIPHYGGRPWLERPPLPFWLTLPVIAVFGSSPAVFRAVSVLVALPCVLLVAWMASLWYGRRMGLAAGLILATLREFALYSILPEADIFLCSLLTVASTLFVRYEFTSADRRTLLALFILAGMANLVKGLFFGDCILAAPILVYLLVGAGWWERVRRYLWLPGWVAFLVVGGAWPVAAWLRQPGVLELWDSDYAGRMAREYMREPIWYYFAHLPWNLFPWTFFAGVGLLATWRQALTQGRTPERWLWCWAIVPLLGLSLARGKHHHYLLPLCAPWAVLSALGVRYVWQRARVAGWNLGVRPALVGSVCLLLLLTQWFLILGPAVWGKSYAPDLAFVQEVQRHIPTDRPILVLESQAPLSASWVLYYLDGRGTLLHNQTFLRTLSDREGEFYLVSRDCHLRGIEQYGWVEPLLTGSQPSRTGPTPADTLVLYRLHLWPNHRAIPAPVEVSPMQATGRAPGPFLH